MRTSDSLSVCSVSPTVSNRDGLPALSEVISSINCIHRSLISSLACLSDYGIEVEEDFMKAYINVHLLTIRAFPSLICLLFRLFPSGSFVCSNGRIGGSLPNCLRLCPLVTLTEFPGYMGPNFQSSCCQISLQCLSSLSQILEKRTSRKYSVNI